MTPSMSSPTGTTTTKPPASGPVSQLRGLPTFHHHHFFESSTSSFYTPSSLGPSPLARHLHYLDISNNFLDGALSDSLFNSYDLRILTLANSEIAGHVPNLAVQLHNLQLLNTYAAFSEITHFSSRGRRGARDGRRREGTRTSLMGEAPPKKEKRKRKRKMNAGPIHQICEIEVGPNCQINPTQIRI